MSKILCWEPIITPEYKTLPDDIRYILSKKYNLEDGSSTLNHQDLKYLEGLKDANIEGASMLINAINKFNSIMIYLR